MRRLLYTSKLVLSSCALLVACRETSGPVRPTPAALQIVAAPATSAPIASDAGVFEVRVTDAGGSAISGVVVTFAVSSGTARASTRADTTTSDGTASTSVTLGTTPGANEITAAVTGLAPAKVTITAVAGIARTLLPAPKFQRFGTALSTAIVSATPRDDFGNASSTPVTWTSRDTALVRVTALAATTARMSVVNRPGQTYIVAQSGSAIDSVLVVVQDASSTPCTFVLAPATLAVGAVTTFDSGVACVRSPDADAEYLVAAHYNTAVGLVSARMEITASGIQLPTDSFPATSASAKILSSDTQSAASIDFETSLRSRERRAMNAYVPAARAWFAANRATAASRVAALRADLREGDVVAVNVNADDFCANPKFRNARVVAVTKSAVILADVTNPVDGFTDAEYRSFGVDMDTLVNPLDTAAFGAPSDIDGNGRVGVLFTSAVNALSLPGSGSVVLGFYYSRDLLPKRAAGLECPGSNASEMFYMLVPDPDGTVNANMRTKAFVAGIVVGTIVHEYQHLINASRRMYVNDAPRVDEDVWLNEGLSHIAEELVFYRVTGLTPRQNIAAAVLDVEPVRDAFDRYQRNNFGRYREFLVAPQSNGPIAANDLLATRGATWSFLRYLADRTRTSDGDFWHRLVNSRFTGVANLDDALSGTGLTTLSALRDWSIAVAVDDIAPNIPNAFVQPSWNFVSALPAVGLGDPYPLVPRSLVDANTAAMILGGGTSQYGRFGLGQNREALIVVSGPNGSALPPGARLTLVRIK